MSKKLILLKPTIKLHNQYLDFYREWQQSGEAMIPWVIEKDPTDFEGMLRFLMENERGENLPDNLVANSTFWLISEDKRVLGVVNIRHKLTKELLTSGGHVGYGIRPSERRKGYATRILALALEKCKKLGIVKVLVVCEDDNIASERTILKNGGIQDSSYIKEDGSVIKRFWIENES